MRSAVWTANLLGWPILQIAIARLTLSLPLKMFAGDRPFYAIHSWGRSWRIYKMLAIKRWKTLLPDGGPW
jgi:glycosyl-4,4'-diaponeurosporenoate acyltransferase